MGLAIGNVASILVRHKANLLKDVDNIDKDLTPDEAGVIESINASPGKIRQITIERYEYLVHTLLQLKLVDEELINKIFLRYRRRSMSIDTPRYVGYSSVQNPLHNSKL